MNWYKISKSPVKLPDGMEEYIKEHLPKYIEQCKWVQKSHSVMIQVLPEFTNPYTGKKEEAKIYFKEVHYEYPKMILNAEVNVPVKGEPSLIYVYIPDDCTVTAPALYNVLIHEISHIIDPYARTKRNEEINKKLQTYEIGGESEKYYRAYYNSPTEINSFQKGIINKIISDVKSGRLSKEDVLNILRGDDSFFAHLDLLNYPAEVRALTFWNKYKPSAIKLLQQRLYTALQNMDKD